MSSTESFFLVIGAGAAGLQFSYFCHKHGRSYVVLERKPHAGGQFSNFPRHRGLISINKVFTGETDYEKNLRFDWNSLLLEEEDREKQPLFKTYTQEYYPNADFLVMYLKDFARNLNLNVHYNQEVERISKKNGKFRIQTNQHTFTCTALVNCSGYSKPFLPFVPGIEIVEHYPTMSTNPEQFRNQHVLIMGKGNSGFETAEKLIPTAAIIHMISPSPIKFAWKTHYIGHVRAVNNNFLDTYQLKSQNAVLDATINHITMNAHNKFEVNVTYSHAMGETETLVYDRVLNCTGFSFDSVLFDTSCKPDLAFKGKFPAQKPNWESTNVENLFFVGVLSHCLDFKRTTSGFIHGFRYNARCLFRLLNLRYFNVPFPSYKIRATVKDVVDQCIKRATFSSGLWQLWGTMRDLIVIDPDHKTATVHEEVSRYQIPNSNAVRQEDYYEFSLEFNKVEGDPFNIQRAPVPERSGESIFIHPVLRHYKRGKLVGEKHLLEDLYTDWTHPTQHVAPLMEFVTEQFLLHSAPTNGRPFVFSYDVAGQMPRADKDHMMIIAALLPSRI